MFVAVNWFGLLPEDADTDSVGVYRYVTDSSVELVADANDDSSGSDLVASPSTTEAGFELTISDLKGISGYNNYGLW